MSRYVSISVAAKTLGVSIQTLRRWDEEGVLVADRTPKNHRRYDLSKITPELIHDLAIQNNRKRLLMQEFRVTTKRLILKGRNKFWRCIAPSKVGHLN